MPDGIADILADLNPPAGYPVLTDRKSDPAEIDHFASAVSNSLLLFATGIKNQL